ncbi:MAG: glycoside hydrolase family 3 protein [Actinomycetota bacterium]|nr:glycoside hydrolase family 3 protein [Actinomycetota bacterium]
MRLKKYIKLIIPFIIYVIIISVFLLLSCKKENLQDSRNAEISSEEEANISLEQATPSLKQMIGQMLIVGFRGTEVSSNSKIVQDINEYNIGGVILFDYDVPSKSFPRNILSPQQLKKLTEDLQKFTCGDLIIAVDAEGGYVNRLKEEYGFIEIRSAKEMGEGNPEDTFFEVSQLGEELESMGINFNLAPVVDVNINKDNPVIGKIDRSFSEDPQKVYEHAAAFINAMHRYDIITAIKHFPGHGSSTEDSHLGLTDVTMTYNEEFELLPYKKLIEEGIADVIMTAHIMNTDIDSDRPATLSSIYLDHILREELNYDGVVISDDMQMSAITSKFGFEDAIIKAVNAGCNLLIFSNNSSEYDCQIAQKATHVIEEAVNDGKIVSDKITDSYNSLKELKEKYGI